MISKTRNIDEASARDRLLADLQSYYANDQELRRRLRTLESLLREKEDKFNLLESDFQNERAVLDNASKLISAGLDEKWLSKLRNIIGSYGTDIDTLAQELKVRDSLNASIEDLRRTRKTLEDEERLLRQKVVAAEDQRIKTLSLINDLILHPPRPPATTQPDVAKEIVSFIDDKDFSKSAQKAIELIREKLPPDSPARLVLDHALLALRLESSRKR
jgi:predicted  nucleic acid-binding Zn-ribbon protein